MKLNLTHNPSSGLIKVDGAVVGHIKKIKSRHVFIHFKFGSDVQCSDKEIDELLPKVRRYLEENS